MDLVGTSRKVTGSVHSLYSNKQNRNYFHQQFLIESAGLVFAYVNVARFAIDSAITNIGEKAFLKSISGNNQMQRT